MLKKTIIQNQWKKCITSGIFIRKNENLGIYTTHVYRGENQLNWERLWMYLNHQFNAIKTFSKTEKKSAIVSDYVFINQTIKNITKRTALCSYWNNKNIGDLTNILITTNKPNFIINVGMEFPKRFFGETKILLVPTINFINNMNLPLYRGVYYNIPFLNKETFLLKQLATSYANLLDKYNNFSKQYTSDLFDVSLQYILRKRFAHFDFKKYLIKKTTENIINLKTTEKKWFNLIKQSSQNYINFFKIYWKFCKLKQYTFFVERKKRSLNSKNKFKYSKIKLKKLKNKLKYLKKFKNLKKKFKYFENKNKIKYLKTKNKFKRFKKKNKFKINLKKKLKKNLMSVLFLSQKLYIYQLQIKMRKKLYLYELSNFLFSIDYKIHFLCKKIILKNHKIKTPLYFIYFNKMKKWN